MFKYMTVTCSLLDTHISWTEIDYRVLQYDQIWTSTRSDFIDGQA